MNDILSHKKLIACNLILLAASAITMTNINSISWGAALSLIAMWLSAPAITMVSANPLRRQFAVLNIQAGCFALYATLITLLLPFYRMMNATESAADLAVLVSQAALWAKVGFFVSAVISTFTIYRTVKAYVAMRADPDCIGEDVPVAVVGSVGPMVARLTNKERIELIVFSMFAILSSVLPLSGVYLSSLAVLMTSVLLSFALLHLVALLPFVLFSSELARPDAYAYVLCRKGQRTVALFLIAGWIGANPINTILLTVAYPILLIAQLTFLIKVLKAKKTVTHD